MTLGPSVVPLVRTGEKENEPTIKLVGRVMEKEDRYRYLRRTRIKTEDNISELNRALLSGRLDETS